MVRIGSYIFDVNRKEVLDQEEIVDIIMDECAENILELIMDYNEKNWRAIPVYFVPEERKDGIHIVPDKATYMYPGHSENEEAVYHNLQEISKNVVYEATDENRKKLSKYRTLLENFVFINENEEDPTASITLLTILQKGEDPIEEEEQINYLLYVQCLKDLNINTFQKLQRAARIAKEMWQEETGSDEDPFEEYGYDDEDEDAFAYCDEPEPLWNVRPVWKDLTYRKNDDEEDEGD